MPPTENKENQPSQKRREPVGPLVGIVVIVLLFLLGALYLIITRPDQRQIEPPSYIPGDQV